MKLKGRVFRCPYCKHTFGPEPTHVCPQCGRTMRVPGPLYKRDPKVILRRRKLRKLQATRPLPDSSEPLSRLGRKPGAIFFMMMLMIIVGGLLIGRSRMAVPEQVKDPPADIAARELLVLRIALERFKQDCGNYPDPGPGLRLLISNPGVPAWDGPYVTLLRPDPWHRRYGYDRSGAVVAVYSLGPDGLPGTDDDIKPPEPTPEEVAR